MKKLIKIAALVIAAALLGVITLYSFQAAAEGDGKKLGIVVADENVDLVATTHPGTDTTVVVDTVIAPDDSWVVVHLYEEGMPGPKIGITRVDRGESRNVAVELEGEFSADEPLLVVLHADRGIRDRFEFAMDYFDKSPDKPYFVDGMKLSAKLEPEAR